MPGGIVRSACPADHPVCDEIGDYRHNDQSNRLAADVGQRIERNLAAVKCRGITAEIGGKRVTAFVASGGKEKNDVPDEA